MSVNVESAPSLELPRSWALFFPNPFISHLSSPFYYVCKSPSIRFQVVALLFGIGVSIERVELKFGLDFVSPLLSFLSFFSIFFLFFY
jgi:hypothetical protein